MLENTEPKSDKTSEPKDIVDDVIFRCFAQGQHWGTADKETGKLDPDYEPENPIDRTEANEAIQSHVKKEVLKGRLDELKLVDKTYRAEISMGAFLAMRTGELQAQLKKEES